MSKRFCKFSVQKSKLSPAKEKNQIKHPPSCYLGRKKPGLVLFEMLMKLLKKNKTFSY